MGPLEEQQVLLTSSAPFFFNKKKRLGVVVHTLISVLRQEDLDEFEANLCSGQQRLHSETLSQKSRRKRGGEKGKRRSRSSEMAPQVKVLATKSNDLSLIPGTYLVEGEN